MRIIRMAVAVTVVALALPAIVLARTPVDPATLTPPPPPGFNPVCERVGNGVICTLAFSDPPVVDEPSGVFCGTTELLFSQERSVDGKRFYDADGFLLRRHFHEDLSGTWTNPDTGATANLAGGFMNLHDLAVPGDVGTGTTRSSGSVRIYVPGGGHHLPWRRRPHGVRRGDRDDPGAERATSVRGLFRPWRPVCARSPVRGPDVGRKPATHPEAERRPCPCPC
jgi:hypothetical protein